ncbi:hypothetical protein SIN8267_01888 [Sinobacterium norvegicum]|uniref:Uncharacterized protein n=1 Tax=Sinobacterium norvegicum TaxID=1641715 RepID=A0ABM9AEZ9_9GAMM|nr:hypothetical protein [Sinobacterium norvegicum]CAH0991774.1 hypothetical protein SIN8267_01888 [Sinobacterium norvegicum]
MKTSILVLAAALTAPTLAFADKPLSHDRQPTMEVSTSAGEISNEEVINAMIIWLEQNPKQEQQLDAYLDQKEDLKDWEGEHYTHS